MGLLHQLRLIESQREEWQEALEDWQDLLSRPAANRLWREFTDKGGVASAEFEKFIAGKPFRNRPTRGKRHLRLIHNAPAVFTVVKRRWPVTPDAA